MSVFFSILILILSGSWPAGFFSSWFEARSPVAIPAVGSTARGIVAATDQTGHLPQNRYRYTDLLELMGGDRPVTTNGAYPKDLQTPLELSARAAYAFDVHSGYPYFSKHASEPLPLASLTKLVVAYRVAQEKPVWMRAAQLEAEDRRGGGGLNIPAGNTLSVEDLWYATLVGSYNNAAAALVRVVSGDEAVFIEATNRWVQNQGLFETRFVEVTGLSSENVSTAEEIGVLARIAFYQEDVFRALRTPTYTIVSKEGNRAHLTSTNQFLLAKDQIVVVGKTGFTEEAGYHFISLGKLRGHEIITVILGAESLAARFSQTKALYQWIAENYVWE